MLLKRFRYINKSVKIKTEKLYKETVVIIASICITYQMGL